MVGGLSFVDVTKRFGAMTAVDNLNLDVAEGEFVAVVGSSGCGKTTSLRILAGLEEATSGQVHVAGRDVTDMPARARNLAMVFQSYALYPHMSAADNIGFALELAGVGKAERDRRILDAASRLGIDKLLDRRPKELSGGQRQRVALARCIVREPLAFLFDEPLSNLDAKLRASARAEISKLQKSLGITSLYVTHDQVEAMTMADRIVVMDSGRIRQMGAPMDLYMKPRDVFVASFLGSPPINLISGRTLRSERGLRFVSDGLEVTVPVEGAYPEGPSTLGIRPEMLLLGSDVEGPSIPVSATVVYVEQHGAEQIVEVELERAPGTPVIARVGGNRSLKAGDAARFSVPLNALHFFDAAGDRLALDGRLSN